MNRLVIIDGNAILHRAFHALPPLTDPEGKVVNAVYGFTSMLFKLYSDLAPSHIAVCFDRPEPTFRKKMFKDYQIHRPEMDETLVPQIERVHSVVESLGIPIFEKAGFEADDVIGTLSHKILNSKFEFLNKSQIQNSNDQKRIDQIIIVTGDKDILQLVEEGKVYVYMPTKGLSQSMLYGEKETMEKIGVKPNQVPDFKALAGDSSDNYPGVEGIGPKTAISLLEQSGTVEKLYKNLKKGKYEMSEKVLERLVKDKKNAMLSLDLATIRKNVPIKIKLTQIDSLDTNRAREELAKLGFKSLLKRLANTNEKETKVKETKKETKDEKKGEQQELF
ncbi:5'-3' exonuclease H3TH domain-containing protein [Patescibacteria group bacterium]